MEKMFDENYLKKKKRGGKKLFMEVCTFLITGTQFSLITPCLILKLHKIVES